MATIQNYVINLESSLEDLPIWKRELILRKRANSKIHSGLALQGATPNNLPLALQNGPHQLQPRSVQGPSQSLRLLQGNVDTLCSTQGPTRSLQSPIESSTPGLTQPLRSLHGSNDVIRSLSGGDHPHLLSTRSVNNNAVSSHLAGVNVCSVVGSGSELYRNDVIASVNTSGVDTATVNIDMHHKGLHDGAPRVASCLSSEEELSYGPGIVSKLKNRYLSLAMRECKARPALRRFSSLEDLLDADENLEPPSPWQERGRPPAKTKPVTTSSGRREAMKRTRSMDSLALRNKDSDVYRRMPKSKSTSNQLHGGSVASALGKDDIIIIETTPTSVQEIHKPESNKSSIMNGNGHPRGDVPPLTRRSSSSSMVGEKELPPPDTVRHVKQIFEVRQVRGTAASRVAAFKANQVSKSNGITHVNKPALKAKPVGLHARKHAIPPTQSPRLDEVRSSLSMKPQVSRPGPRSTLNIRSPVAHIPNGEPPISITSPTLTLSGMTPVTASVTAPLVNGSCLDSPEEGGPKVALSPISNIHNESNSQEFKSTSSVKPPRPVSPTPKDLPPSPVPAHRVSIPKAFKTDKESQRVQLENLKNSEKSRPLIDSPETTKLKPDFTPVPDKVDSVKTTNNKNMKIVSKKNNNASSPVKSMPKTENKKGGLTKKVEISEKVNSVIISKSMNNVNKVRDSNNVNPKTDSKIISKSDAKLVIDKSPTENLLKSTSVDQEVVEAINRPTAVKENNGSVNSPGNKQQQRWHQQENNTLVFNFADKKDIPDYIENDGLIRSSRRPQRLDSGYMLIPGHEGAADSSTDDFEPEELGLDYLDGVRPGVLPPPSGIVFHGEAVIINGRSNLQRQPKSRKLIITFDDSATSTFEYPSELSLLESLVDSSLNSSMDYTISQSTQHTHANSSVSMDADTTLLSQGGLASYTPSKLQLGSKFELGVSRTTAPPTPPRPQERNSAEVPSEDYIRPADDSQTKTWSAEGTSDMLF